MADGIGADDLGGALDVDAAQTGSPREQRLRAQSQTWSDRAAQVFAFFRDHLELRRRAEVDHDARTAVALNGSDAVREAVGAELGRIVDQAPAFRS